MKKRFAFFTFLILFLSAGNIFAQTTRNVGSGQTYSTIQAAINASNNGDTINLLSSSHQEVSIIVNKDVIIKGQGVSETELRGKYLNPDLPGGRIFFINSGNTVVIQDMKITKGGAAKGINASTAGDNGANGRSGGAIYNEGNLTVKRCLFHYNIAGFGGNGKAGADSPVADPGDVGQDGQAGGNGGNGGNGGAIANSNILLIENCLFTNNYAGGAGDGATGGKGGTGGQGTYGTNSYGQTGGKGGDGGNAGYPGSGGAIANLNGENGTITVINSTFCSNSTGFLGLAGDGGEGGYGGYGNAADPTVYGPGGTGGLGGNGGNGNSGATGGAIVNVDGTVTSINNTFSENITWFNTNLQAGAGGRGGHGGSSQYAYGGDGGKGGDGGEGASSGNGGALYTSYGDVFTIINTIVYDNEIQFSTSLGGDAGAAGFSGSGGQGAGNVGLPGSAGDNGSKELGDDCSGSFDSEGYNIIKTRAGSTGWITEDLSEGTNPNLQSLTNNGGYTKTMAILSSSPANNAGAASHGTLTIPNTDQRDIHRQNNSGNIDIGAFELRNISENLVINEVDAYGNQEFIELYDGGVGNTWLDETVIVFYDGNTDENYDVIDLTGYQTDANGYFLLSSSSFPGVEINFLYLQNGADAIVLYKGTENDYPLNGSLVTTDIIDAIVYDIGEADDSELLTLLNASQAQINEDQNSAKSSESMQRISNGTGGQRNTDTYMVLPPTPGEANSLPPSLTTSVSSIDFGDVYVGNSNILSYTLTGENLTSSTVYVGATVTGNYQVSLSSSSGFQDYISIAPSGGTINTTIYVKFSVSSTGTFSTNIANDGGGATTKNVAVTGKGVEQIIEVSPTTLNFGEVETGTSVVMNYNLTGSNLSNDITITAPSSFYKVSLSETSGFASYIIVPETNGSVDETIYVQFTPTAQTTYSGNVTNVSSGATSKNIAVTGTGVGTVATINTSTSSIDYGNVPVESIRVSHYSLSWNNIGKSDDITITCPTGYKVSSDLLGIYTSTLVYSPSGSTGHARIYIKFYPTTETTYSGNIENSCPGATTKNVAVTGVGVIPVISVDPLYYDFEDVQVGETAESSYTLTGEYTYGNITITAPTDYKISETSGSGFVSTLNVAATNGELNTTIYVQYAPTTEGDNNNSLQHTNGSTTKSFGLFGTGIAPSITVSPISNDFGEIEVGESSEWSYTVTAIHLSDDLVISTPKGYEVSLTSGLDFTNTLLISPSGEDNEVNETIYVQFAPNSTGTIAGNITNASTNASTKNVAVTGVGFERIVTISVDELDFDNVAVGQSSTLTYTIEGENLNDDIDLSVGSGFTISTDNSTFTSSLALTPVGGTVALTTIYVKFSPVSETDYHNSVANECPGANFEYVSVNGVGVVPTITITPATLDFGQVETGTTNNLDYTIEGCGLTNDIDISVPDNSGFTISTDNSTFETSLTLFQTNGTVASTIIYVKFSPDVDDTYSEIISNTSTDATTKEVSLSADSYTGLVEKSNFEISVFPNPTSEFVSIKTEKTPLNIIISDITGKTIYNFFPTSDITKIDFTQQASGIYFIRINTEYGIYSEKIIKK